MAKELCRRFAPLSGGFTALSAATRFRITAFASCIAAATAVAALPSGYLEFEYIKGNGTDARIITDYTPTPNQDKIEAVVSFPSGTLNQNQAIWCARGASTSTATWTLFVLSSSGYKFRFDYGNTIGTAVTPALSATDAKYTVTANGPAFTWSGGDGQTHTGVADYTAGGPLVLFASYYNGVGNNLGNYGKFKLYSFKVWRSGALIHDLVPALRLSDYKSGLYDVAADKFYAGTGTFTLMDYWNTKGYVAASPNEILSAAETAYLPKSWNIIPNMR